MITDSVSTTKMIPIRGRIRIWPVMSAVTASVDPRARAPASPMKIWAGWTLNHRNPSSAPMISAHSRARLTCWGTLNSAMSMKATNENARVPPASPSRPSVRLTPFAMATIANAANAMYSVGSIGTAPTNGTAMAVIA